MDFGNCYPRCFKGMFSNCTNLKTVNKMSFQYLSSNTDSAGGIGYDNTCFYQIFYNSPI
jgi:hypothetical protein